MESLVNFRDIGGYKTLTGKKVQTQRIFRSGEVVNLTPADRQAFTEFYGIQHIYDFRGDREVTERPDETFQNVAYKHIDIMQDLAGKTASFTDMLDNADHPDAGMLLVYEELVLSNSGRRGYHEFLMDLVTHPNENGLFHCFAGKDRTGVGAALILGTLGVSEADIYADYLKTNEQRKKANDEILARLQEQGASEEKLAGMETLLYVKKDYLSHAFQLIKQEFGTWGDYLANGLNLPKDFTEELQQAYLAD